MVTQRLTYTPHVTLSKLLLLQLAAGPHELHSRAKAIDRVKKQKSLPQFTTKDTTFPRCYKKKMILNLLARYLKFVDAAISHILNTTNDLTWDQARV